MTCDADDKDVEAHNSSLHERFKSGLSDPMVMAFSVLNRKWWPDVVLKQDKPD
jgi:hypothetical protein